MKKGSTLKTLFLTLVLIFTIPLTTLANDFEPYGAGEWDLIYDKNITATSSGTNTTTLTSGGGDIRVCISGVEPGNSIDLRFYTSAGKLINPVMFASNTGSSPSSYACLKKVDVRPYVNSNGKVQLYLKATSKNRSSDTVRIVIED